MKNNKCNASLGQENSVGSTFVHNVLGLGEGNAQSNISNVFGQNFAIF
jgi:hypothetical protein